MTSRNVLRSLALAGVMMVGAAPAALAADGCIDNQSSFPAEVAFSTPGSASARIDMVDARQRSCFGDTTGMMVRLVVRNAVGHTEERTWDDGQPFTLIAIRKTGMILTQAGPDETLQICRDDVCSGRFIR